MDKNYWISISGNILDHYDTNLYGFMAPILAPLFFPNHDPIVQLIFAYGLLSSSVISRPLGAFCFGFLARFVHPQICLSFSLVGVALATGSMAFLPTYSSIGFWAPILLAILRCLQGFFGGGESCIAGLYIVGRCPKELHGWYGGLYQSSTVIGILLASGAVWAISDCSLIDLWRIPFLIGLGAGICGVILRFKAIQINKIEPIVKRPQTTHFILKNPSLLIRIALISSFSYLTYVLPFVFLNGFVPLISKIKASEMLAMNTIFLFMDAAICPFLGKLSDRFDTKRFMVTMVISLALISVPGFLLLPTANLMTIALFRMIIVLIGLGFLAPMYGWFLKELPDSEERYLIKGVAYNLGTELFGRSMPAICLSIWHYTGSLALVGSYPVFLALLALMALYWRNNN